MSREEVNPFISYYGKYNISPVRQDISDFSRHLLRRERLFVRLGLPSGFFSGRTILEVGPGGGHNALAYFKWGANVDFVEPNPKAQEDLLELFDKYGVDRKRYNLYRCKIEEFDSCEKYDLVIAEGVIPGLYDRREIIKKLTSFVKIGGAIVVTCCDDISYFFEILKRLIGFILLKKKGVVEFNDKVRILSQAFESHLKSLKYSSRFLSDWVMDQFFTPYVTGKMFSIAECIEEFGREFLVLGCSPSMFTDYSWYKNLDFNMQEHKLKQFYKKRHILFFYDLEESERPIGFNEELAARTKEFRSLVGILENEYNDKNMIDIIQNLHELKVLASTVDTRISDAIDESVRLISDNEIDELKIHNAEKLAQAFGKGQQYVSLTKLFTTSP